MAAPTHNPENPHRTQNGPEGFRADPHTQAAQPNNPTHNPGTNPGAMPPVEEWDFTIDALMAGRAAPWLSKPLITPWPRPIPGPSLVEKTAKRQLERQTFHPRCGSLHNPPPGTVCEWSQLPLHESVPRRQDEGALREEVLESVELVTLNDLDFARAYCRREMEMGLRAMDELEARQAQLENASASPVEAEPVEAEPVEAAPVEAAPVEAEPVEADPVEPAPVEPEPVKPAPIKPVRVKAARLQALKNAELLTLIRCGSQAAERLKVLTLERRRVAYLCVEASAKVDVKGSFMEDRAVALAHGTLLALDRAFTDLGFGAWMPFRYPDQFLMMTSLMEKLFAANGLITPKGANHWRKFIEETPDVERAPLEMPSDFTADPRSATVRTLKQLIEEAKNSEQAEEIREKLRRWQALKRAPP
jgi:hypothetical protein